MADADRAVTRRPSMVRRIGATVAFVLAMGWLVSRTCAGTAASATIVVELAEAGASAARVDIQLLPPNSSERLANFEGSTSGDPPAVSWPLQVQEGDYTLVATVHADDGVRTYRRDIVVKDRATIRVRLDPSADDVAR